MHIHTFRGAKKKKKQKQMWMMIDNDEWVGRATLLLRVNPSISESHSQFMDFNKRCDVFFKFNVIFSSSSLMLFYKSGNVNPTLPFGILLFVSTTLSLCINIQQPVIFIYLLICCCYYYYAAIFPTLDQILMGLNKSSQAGLHFEMTPVNWESFYLLRACIVRIYGIK